MDRALRRLTPLVLLALAAIVWFEESLLGKEVGVTRFVIGVLCIYTLLGVLERQRLEQGFKQVLASFKNYYEQRPGGGDDARKGLEAARILIAALTSADEAVRTSAHQNLKRLTGKDFGLDVAAWRTWLDAAEAASAEADEPPGS